MTSTISVVTTTASLSTIAGLVWITSSSLNRLAVRPCPRAGLVAT